MCSMRASLERLKDALTGGPVLAAIFADDQQTTQEALASRPCRANATNDALSPYGGRTRIGAVAPSPAIGRSQRGHMTLVVTPQSVDDRCRWCRARRRN